MTLCGFVICLRVTSTCESGKFFQKSNWDLTSIWAASTCDLLDSNSLPTDQLTSTHKLIPACGQAYLTVFSKNVAWAVILGGSIWKTSWEKEIPKCWVATWMGVAKRLHKEHLGHSSHQGQPRVGLKLWTVTTKLAVK
jgi:hypothetical protein